jgi:uncharacterized ion transporter superfamily protein YfcC
MTTTETSPAELAPNPEPRSQRGQVIRASACLAGLVVSAIAGFTVEGNTLWGLFPIALYAALSIAGVDIVLAKLVGLGSALLLLQSSPAAVGDLMGSATADFVTQIGIIIMLGAGVGQVLRVTGVAERIVVGVLRLTGQHSERNVLVGILISCFVLVASLGTLAGALAIAAPVLIPVAARIGFTRSTTAAAMFLGGCAGLAVAPFAGSNVAIMDAADLDYLSYLKFAAGPLAALSLILAMFIVPLVQRRTTGKGDEYGADDSGAPDTDHAKHTSAATMAFVTVLLASVVYAAMTKASTTFPLFALPVIGIVTGLGARMPVTQVLAEMYEGARHMVRTFFMFWILAALFLAIDQLAPFEVILDRFGSDLMNATGLGFIVLIGLLGWIGIPGATAAQVVLINKVFGGIAAALGIPAGIWAIALLWGSKADTYGPFPNGNMVGAMGLARSTNLRSLLGVGWLVLIPACLMYVCIAAICL